MKKISLLIAITFASCNTSITNVSELIEAHEKATTNNTNWNDFNSKKAFYNFKIKIGGKLVNSVDQVVSTKGFDFQKTETFQNDVLSQMIITQKGNTSVVKFESGEFFGVNDIPAETVSISTITRLKKSINEFHLKDTLWSDSLAYLLVNDSLGETYVFDQNSKYLKAIITQNMYGKSTTVYSDYRAESGFVLPFKIVTSIPEAGYETEMTFSKIVVNPNFDSDYFELDKTWNRLAKGGSIPDFELPYAEDDSIFLKSQDLKGKIVLIDFWATWCKPCLEEFPIIKDNYKTYGHKGFEVVSISVDKDKDRLLKFLKANPFPWKNSLYSEGELRSDLAKNFQIVALPKQILLDENGKIIAMDNDLRDGKLEKILKNMTN